jgi:hypothetical protein
MRPTPDTTDGNLFPRMATSCHPWQPVSRRLIGVRPRKKSLSLRLFRILADALSILLLSLQIACTCIAPQQEALTVTALTPHLQSCIKCGVISGTVLDPKGEPVIGAVITLVCPADSPSVATDMKGQFIIKNLTPSSECAIVVRSCGYIPVAMSPIQLLERQAVSVTVVMQFSNEPQIVVN